MGTTFKKKGKRDRLTLDEVIQVCEKLMTDGEKVTVRNVLAVTGGGFATVSDFIKQWQEQQVVSDATDLPKTLITALKMAYKSMLSEQEASYQQKLNLEAQHTQEALDQVTLLEKTTAELQNELEKYQHATTSQIMALEKELSISALRLEDSNKREQKIADELNKVRHKLHEAEIQLAVLKAKNDQLDKHTHKNIKTEE
ncbi:MULTISPECIES: DNA-binding protein [Cysteiniphilum]|uniref:KfrA N-terminal DNA-binding domain-containing protein n=1 Tax=Cysteiniphilum litorale TaxID=2056700 RepID=A0A8J2Z6H7_9GAMM|nr:MULTISPECIES: DNA-binding protein [Cysteiniphilum]GGG05793.1 hypothetical protein GCM10010995_24130 [Cysteiniphilum litorale]